MLLEEAITESRDSRGASVLADLLGGVVALSNHSHDFLRQLSRLIRGDLTMTTEGHATGATITRASQ